MASIIRKRNKQARIGKMIKSRRSGARTVAARRNIFLAKVGRSVSVNGMMYICRRGRVGNALDDNKNSADEKCDERTNDNSVSVINTA